MEIEEKSRYNKKGSCCALSFISRNGERNYKQKGSKLNISTENREVVLPWTKGNSNGFKMERSEIVFLNGCQVKYQIRREPGII